MIGIGILIENNEFQRDLTMKYRRWNIGANEFEPQRLIFHMYPLKSSVKKFVVSTAC